MVNRAILAWADDGLGKFLQWVKDLKGVVN